MRKRSTSPAGIKGYLGKALVALDWEQGDNAAWGNTGYLDSLVAKVKELTGVTPLIYASQSVFPWDVAKKHGCGTWVAQYANNDTTGLQSSPWNEGAYQCDIRQYSSCGRLGGWSGNLDLNKAYMEAAKWQQFAAVGGAAQPAPTPNAPETGVEKMDALDLVAGVFRDEYGKEDDRRRALGSRYDEVQNIVNHICSASAETLAQETWAGDYLYVYLLAHRYDEVMAVINGDVDCGQTYTVKSGDTLSALRPSSARHIKILPPKTA